MTLTNGHLRPIDPVVVEPWVSIGQAARLAHVHPSTVRRWADAQKVRSRVTPGGHRQIATDSLLVGFERETATRSTKTAADQPASTPTTDPYSSIVHLAEMAEDWTRWNPSRMSEKRLATLTEAATKLIDAISDVAGTAEDELRDREHAAVDPDDPF